MVIVVKASTFGKEELSCENIYVGKYQIFLSDYHWPNFTPHKMKSQLEKDKNMAGICNVFS
jgi:hypothetical protein